ncbi:MAG: hypothetical protein ABL995_06180 [Bryobacteraceae bacterium]
MRPRAAITALLFFALALPSSAQWLRLKTPGLPRTPEGKPLLNAPAPRTAEGRPDLSGVWQKIGDRYANNIAADLEPGEITAWAESIYQTRKLGFGKDAPAILCLPQGPAYLVNMAIDTRIVQTPTLIVLANADLSHRELFMDGRQLEEDPNPTWMGYSIAHWEENDLVVESNGYNDKTWLDWDGHPHTEELRITERYTRFNYGRMNVEITYTDPKVFPKPITVGMEMRLRADTEMLEYVCENEKDRQHMVAANASDVVTVPVDVLKRYVGVYDMKENGNTIALQITLEKGILYYDWGFDGRQPLTPFGEKLFSLAGTWVEFVADEGGGPASGVRVKFVEGEDYGARRK